jgi:hypothetical protein
LREQFSKEKFSIFLFVILQSNFVYFSLKKSKIFLIGLIQAFTNSKFNNHNLKLMQKNKKDLIE